MQRKLSASAKQELSISELIMLADYFECNFMELVIGEDDKYIGPSPDWKDGWRKIEVEDKSPEEVNHTLKFLIEFGFLYKLRVR